MAKDWAKTFYNSRVWQQQRLAILKRDRYRCTEPGCRRTAEEVHHIVELTEQNVGDVNISLNPSNLRSVCSDCHKRITKAMKEKGNGILQDIIFDEDGFPIPANAAPGGLRKNERAGRPTPPPLWN